MTNPNPPMRPSGNPLLRPSGNPLLRPSGNPLLRPAGNILLRPAGNFLKRPTGNLLKRPTGNFLKRPTGKFLKRPTGKFLKRPASVPAVAALFCALLALSTAASAAARQESGFPLDAQDHAEIDAADRRRLGPPAGEPLSGTALAERTQAVAGLMRCPSCQGLSVADSPTSTAAAMRALIERLVAEGYTQEQVLAYFEASYGEFIRLAPRPRGFNLLVWITPAAILLLGLALIARRLRGARHAEREAGELERYRRRVRAETEG